MPGPPPGPCRGREASAACGAAAGPGRAGPCASVPPATDVLSSTGLAPPEAVASAAAAFGPALAGAAASKRPSPRRLRR